MTTTVPSGLDPALVQRVDRRVGLDPDVAADPADRATLRRAVARALAAEGVVVAPARWAQLVRDLVDDLAGLGPVEALLRDPAVTDVLINAPRDIWIERDDRLEPTTTAFRDEAHLLTALARVLGPLGVRLDRSHPWADAALEGGVRLHAVVPPLAPAPIVTLRRTAVVVPSWEELIAAGTLDDAARDRLVHLVRHRRNLVVAGRAGAGKTTLLSRLLREVDDDRLVIMEDVAELSPGDTHAVALGTRPPSPDGAGGVDLALLVRNALRMRPDRLVVGEVRGAEVADLLQAMNTGHAGSLTTVHANGPEDALVRLEGMALLAGVAPAAARAQVLTAIDAVVTLERDGRGARRLASIANVGRGDGDVAAVEVVWP